jgi:hypothetical protein
MTVEKAKNIFFHEGSFISAQQSNLLSCNYALFQRNEAA